MINLPCSICKGSKYTYFMRNDVPWSMPCSMCNGSGESMTSIRDTYDTIKDHYNMRLGDCKSSTEAIGECECKFETAEILHDLGRYCDMCQSYR